MKILAQCGIIFAICVAGQVLSVVTHLPVPGNVFGMIILFLLLYFKVIRKQQIRRVSRFLIGNMAFFFIPSGVAIVANFNTIKGVLVPYLLIILFTTIIVLSVTGVFANWVMKLFNRKGGKAAPPSAQPPVPPVSPAKPQPPRRPSVLPPVPPVSPSAEGDASL
ncbi:CidA/LrgA family protein [Ethanoligenens harbinense]|uniref:LrgA family protein n=1 Tax=Ethanoligenens harbinense (strain DSM 18485 / JCM 12961 / CGMCC 1.5033 / YUAN-3) TaxID=663278 RepID=E6U7R4_ETHHY|nr:CidA/LrgA family protein [Ethanoligenens harbinense]ADU28187.1 LrgA family protein [Ethanoligenens harbinense YUAN-3]